MTNGAPDAALQHHGSKGSGERTDPERQQEAMARQWTVSHLQDEMRYIREVSGATAASSQALSWSGVDGVCVLPVPVQVRDSLEKVRERMYGQFGGMQQSMQKLSQEIRVKRKTPT